MAKNCPTADEHRRTVFRACITNQAIAIPTCTYIHACLCAYIFYPKNHTEKLATYIHRIFPFNIR